ncbi:hypothetical protein FGB62_43g03 [Gracilaria domingensis]|nr:hypothetical protein FGB62_43g03 [Gracilaria domingensis]
MVVDPILPTEQSQPTATTLAHDVKPDGAPGAIQGSVGEAPREAARSQCLETKASVTLQQVSLDLTVVKGPTFTFAPSDAVGLSPPTLAAFEELGNEMRNQGYHG